MPHSLRTAHDDSYLAQGLAMLEELTERLMWWLVSVGLTPSRWPGSACGTVILEVKGRRSGALRSLLVTWVEHERERYLVTMAGNEPQWVKNMRAGGGTVTLPHGNHREDRPDLRPGEDDAAARSRVVRGELLRRHARVEADLHLLPEWVKAVALDRIDDAHERATAGKLPLTRVTHVDRVDRSVVGEVRRLAARRKLHEVDREECAVVVGRHRTRDAVHAAGPGGSSEQREHGEHSR